MSYTRQEILDLINTATWATAEIILEDGNKFIVTSDERIIEKLVERNQLPRFAKERTLDDENNVRVYCVITGQWHSIPVKKVAQVTWSEQPEGKAFWED